MGKLGYDDTPLIRDSTYCVHDPKRPAPRVVAPADAVGQAPADAVVLFDGSDLSGWSSVSGGDAGWKVEDGYMEVVPGTGDIQTNAHFGDVQYHFCLLYTSPSPRDRQKSRMPSSA